VVEKPKKRTTRKQQPTEQKRLDTEGVNNRNGRNQQGGYAGTDPAYDNEQELLSQNCRSLF
jgi:hypothetical protein